MFFKKTFSYEGEDQLIQRFFAKVKKGFYLDIGANHPLFRSNTYNLYKKGWKGLCVDALDFSGLYKKFRPRDIFQIASLSSSNKKNVNFYIAKDKTQSSLYKKAIKIHSIKKVETSSINNFLQNFKLPKEIHFMSLDIEGLELCFLKNIELKKLKIGLIVVEDKNLNIMKIEKSKIFKILHSANYVPICKTLLNTFYILPEKKYFSFLKKKNLF